MKMRVLKCLAAIASACVVASAYATACYDYDQPFHTIIPLGTTTSYTITMICDSSDSQTFSSSYWWGFTAEVSGNVNDYRVPPGAPGTYWTPATGSMDFGWSYTDCYNQVQHQAFRKLYAYPSINSAVTCSYP